MKKLMIMMAVFWQVLNCSAYCHSGNRTASGVWPQVKDRICGGQYNNKLDRWIENEDKCLQFGRRNLLCKIEIPS